MKAKVYIGLSNFPKDKKNTPSSWYNFQRPSVSLKHNGHEKFTIAIDNAHTSKQLSSVRCWRGKHQFEKHHRLHFRYDNKAKQKR